MRLRYLFFCVILITGIAMSFMVVPTTAQSCATRSDWPTYTIVRGDTLYRIAVRYHTSTSALASANCISTASLIFVGQVLRIPPTSNGGSGNIVYGTFDIPVTFQQYEQGYMIWRTDTGDVWVYVGQSSGSVVRYPSISYGNLPDNPISQPTPSGRIRPIMGFGKVWGNFVGIRTVLGWATRPEQSFITHYSIISANLTYFTLPDGRLAMTNNAQVWSLSNGPVPTVLPPTPSPQPIPLAHASFQAFQTGFMTWSSDSGVIGVYQGVAGGIVSYIRPSSYARLPDNPIAGPPGGMTKPILGFGKVWGNFDWVRTALGWATGPEQSFNLNMHPTPNWPGTNFGLPDGRIIYVTNNQIWSLTPSAAPPPTATPQTGTVTTTINAAYQLFENGFMLWRGDTGRIEIFTKTDVSGYNLDQYQNLSDNPVSDTPPSARVKPINGFGRVWGNFPSTRNQVGWGLANEQGFQATFKTDLATSVICVNLPDGHFVSYPHYIGNRSWSWQYETSCG